MNFQVEYIVLHLFGNRSEQQHLEGKLSFRYTCIHNKPVPVLLTGIRRDEVVGISLYAFEKNN